MNELEDRLIDCFQAVLPKIGREELRQVSMKSTSQWDSVVTVTLISLIEETFSVETQPGDIERLTSFESIHDYLQRNKQL